MTIQRMTGTVCAVRDLSATAREVTLALPQPLPFLPGAFVNVFIPKDGATVRRAYSISSNPENPQELSLSIRRTDTPQSVSPYFWQDDIIGTELAVMGPLGVNTADKITHPRVFVFTFGIGVSVAKGLLEYLLHRPDLTEVTLVTASRTEDEILYKSFFEEQQKQDARLSTRFVVSRPSDPAYPFRGHIEDVISDYDFTDASVYLCGSKKACESLRTAIEARSAVAPQFLIEAFD